MARWVWPWCECDGEERPVRGEECEARGCVVRGGGRGRGQEQLPSLQ